MLNAIFRVVDMLKEILAELKEIKIIMRDWKQ